MIAGAATEEAATEVAGDRGGGGGFGRGGPPGRGGFGDPGDFLKRLDRNEDGEISPDEQQGPAGFLIQRLQSIDSKIRPGESVSLKRLTKAFETMRSGGGGEEGRGGDDRRRGDDDDDDRRSRSSGDENFAEVARLVPGFGLDPLLMPPPVPGFGPLAETLSTPTTAADNEEAAQILSRYDRDRNGSLSAEETGRGRFWGNPLDFDRNGDGQLSESELATRAAVRRTGQAESNNDDRDRDRKRDGDRDSDEPAEDIFGGRRSYRNLGSGPAGLPGFFTDRDLDGDGQVAMNEYAGDWTDARVAEFLRWDSDGDGVITPDEAIRGVENGATASSAPAGRTSNSTASTPAPAATPSSMPPDDGSPPSAKSLAYVQRIIPRYDKNGDGVLTGAEYGEMLLSPAAADADRDGRITQTEYARWLDQRDAKR